MILTKNVRFSHADEEFIEALLDMGADLKTAQEEVIKTKKDFLYRTELKGDNPLLVAQLKWELGMSDEKPEDHVDNTPDFEYINKVVK